METCRLAYGFFFFVTSTSGGKPEATVRKTHWIRIQSSIKQNNADSCRSGFKTLIKHSKSDADASFLHRAGTVCPTECHILERQSHYQQKY
jgi:hypothetical protein